MVNPDDDPRFKQYWQAYHRIMGRRGVSPEAAKASVHRSTTTIAALMVHLGDADGMLVRPAGSLRRAPSNTSAMSSAVRDGETAMAALSGLTIDKRTLFIADTYVNEVPTSEQLARIARQSVREVRLFGLTPKVAFISHSNYGSSRRESAKRYARRLRSLLEAEPGRGMRWRDARRCRAFRSRCAGGMLMDSRLTGEANILICPNIDAANILFNVLKAVDGEGATVGPILMGVAKPAHVLTPSSTFRRVLNMTAIAAAQAGLPAVGEARGQRVGVTGLAGNRCRRRHGPAPSSSSGDRARSAGRHRTDHCARPRSG